MAWQLTPYTVPLVVSTATAVSLTAYAVFHLVDRDIEPSVAAFALLMGGTSLWAFGYTLELSSVDLAAKLRWLAVLWVGSATVPTALLLFAITYTERESWLTRPRLALLSVQPLVTVFLLPTAESHGLLWRDPSLDTTTSAFATIEFTLGPWYTFSVVYSWLLVTAAIAILLWFVYDSDDLYRGQAAAIVVGAVSPFVASVVFFTGSSPHPNVNPTSVAFSISGVAFATAVFRYRFLDVVPVARDTVVGRMRDGYIVVDDDNNVIDANPAAKQFLPTGTVVGNPITDVLPTDATDTATSDTAAPLPGVPREFVVGDGDETRFVEVRASELDGHRRAGDLLLFRDITAQRRVERRYQRLIERASDIMTVLDSDGTITYQSPSVRRVLGNDPDDSVGECAFDIVHPEDRERVVDAFESVLEREGGQTRVEYRVRDAEGDWRTLEAIAKNLLHDPFVEGVVLNGRDVTDRKERERELRQKNERLDRFASVVSHDLRNPIQIAGANVDLAEETGDPERFDAIRNAVDRMDRLVDDVLTLAREGDDIETTQHIDLGTVAQRGWSAVETGSATLDVPSGATVDADPDRLQRLFENLFRNAVEHGRPRIEDSRDDENQRFSNHSTGNQNAARSGDAVEHGSTSNRPQADDAVEQSDPAVTVTVGTHPDGFFVADDGPGIPPAHREQVFESGFTTDDHGTGFGLDIVARIAEAHGWTVSVTESDSGGARFDVATDSAA